MTEAVQTESQTLEEPGLDDLINEWEDDQAEAEAEANKATPEDLEKARKLAEKINGGFLWAVNKTQSPSVDLCKLTDQEGNPLIDQEKGTEAFLPLAEKFGGEVPPWLAQFEPYIKAGMYMGGVIITARQVEAQVAAQLARQESMKGGQDGEKRESQPAE